MGREVFETLEYRTFTPRIVTEERSRRYGGWKSAVERFCPRNANMNLNY